MFEIPLFPLNTVLFPGTPIHLHIFEERYKQMINLCLQEQRPFGVVLIRNGMEALGPLAEPFHIGCTAEIAHVERLEDGADEPGCRWSGTDPYPFFRQPNSTLFGR